MGGDGRADSLRSSGGGGASIDLNAEGTCEGAHEVRPAEDSSLYALVVQIGPEEIE